MPATIKYLHAEKSATFGDLWDNHYVVTQGELFYTQGYEMSHFQNPSTDIRIKAVSLDPRTIHQVRFFGQETECIEVDVEIIVKRK